MNQFFKNLDKKILIKTIGGVIGTAIGFVIAGVVISAVGEAATEFEMSMPSVEDDAGLFAGLDQAE